MRLYQASSALLTLLVFAACSNDQSATAVSTGPVVLHVQSFSGGGPTDVTDDTTAQNETPLAINPLNPQNLVTGNNDWNYNDGCGVNASLDGGKTWTKTLPAGFVPGVTRYTNDPAVAGTGTGDFGGDPAVGFGPDGTAYFACFTYDGTSTRLLMSRSSDGGRTWLKGGSAEPLALVSAFNGNGTSRGSNGQFPDHEAITVAPDGTVYVTWAQFHGYGSNSPIWIATSTDGARTFGRPVKVSSGSIRSDQNARIVTNASGSVAYVAFDNDIQGGKGSAMFVSKSTDKGVTWSSPIQIATYQNPVCLYPPYCFTISGGQFRGPGSYVAPAFNPVNNRLYVAYSDIVDGRAQIFLTSASVDNLAVWTTPTVVAPVSSGDRFAAELGIAPNGRLDVAFYDRSYSGNGLVDVTFATSKNNGATWASTRVSKSGFDPSKYGVPSGSTIRPFIGDYNGIISTNTLAGMTWTGVGKTYGTLPTNLEIFFASVTP
jgi:hypothetical protein